MFSSKAFYAEMAGEILDVLKKIEDKLERSNRMQAKSIELEEKILHSLEKCCGEKNPSKSESFDDEFGEPTKDEILGYIKILSDARKAAQEIKSILYKSGPTTKEDVRKIDELTEALRKAEELRRSKKYKAHIKHAEKQMENFTGSLFPDGDLSFGEKVSKIAENMPDDLFNKTIDNFLNEHSAIHEVKAHNADEAYDEFLKFFDGVLNSFDDEEDEDV